MSVHEVMRLLIASPRVLSEDADLKINIGRGARRGKHGSAVKVRKNTMGVWKISGRIGGDREMKDIIDRQHFSLVAASLRTVHNASLESTQLMR